MIVGSVSAEVYRRIEEHVGEEHVGKPAGGNVPAKPDAVKPDAVKPDASKPDSAAASATTTPAAGRERNGGFQLAEGALRTFANDGGIPVSDPARNCD